MWPEYSQPVCGRNVASWPRAMIRQRRYIRLMLQLPARDCCVDASSMRCPLTVTKPTAGSVHFPGLYAVVRHVFPRLSPDGPGARLHAAAGPAADRRLPAGAWPVRFIDENIARGQRRRFRLGRYRSGQRHAYPGAADPRYRRARARRPARSPCSAALRCPARPSFTRSSIISTSAKSATPPTG